MLLFILLATTVCSAPVLFCGSMFKRSKNVILFDPYSDPEQEISCRIPWTKPSEKVTESGLKTPEKRQIASPGRSGSTS